jgi:AcrR family transcriptional regulator
VNAAKKTRTVKKPKIRRQEIVATATRLFLDKGYERTSTTDVMKALEIAKGTIYHYFPSKGALMEAVVDQLADDYVQRRVRIVEEIDGDAIVKIEAFFAPGHRTDEETRNTEHLHSEDNVRLHTRLLAVLVEKMAPPFGELIAQGCSEGVFRTEHPLEAAELLLAGVQFLTDDGVYPWDRTAIKRRSLAFPDLAETLLNAPAGSFAWLSRTAEDDPHDGSQSDRDPGERS